MPSSTRSHVGKMMTLVKFLCLLLVGFLAYDTVNFVLVSKSQTQIEVRQESKLAEIKIGDAPDVKADDDMSLGVAFFIFVTLIAGLVVMYYSKVTGKYENQACNVGALALSQVPEQPFMTYYYDVGGDYSRDNPRLMNNFSEIQLTLEPNPPSDDVVRPVGDDALADALPRFQKADNDYNDLTETCEETEEDIIDINLLSDGAVQRNNGKRDVLMATQTDSSLACDCNLEQFEERLGAVEHGLMTSSEATKEWSKRIEQAEVDLVNLHRQMYTILSKAEFVAPSSEIFSKTAGDATPFDFYEPTLYRVPDIIVETKKELEQGDLFRKSLTKQSAEDNWSAAMEEELTDKIKELTSSNSQQFQQSTSSETTDPIRIKESLMKKNEELKEKTRTIVKEMEDALRATNARKNKLLGVHSRYVQPYKRIRNADTDNYNPVNLKPKMR